MRSSDPAAPCMLSSLVETTKLVAPISRATDSLLWTDRRSTLYLTGYQCSAYLGDVEMAVTELPMAAASLTPICPRPPIPTIPTLRPPLLA